VSATPAKPPEGEEPAKKKGPGMIVWILVSAISAGAGFAVPSFLHSGGGHKEPHDEAEAKAKAAADSKPAFIEFGQVQSPLNERMPTFIAATISLQVDSGKVKEVEAAITDRRPLLESWLQSTLADKDLEEVRGMAGQNMLRREILDHFNSVLFPDGYDRIYEVLFTKWMVQQ
jgi:flagellar basal body-associated protein FliL